MVGYGFSPKTEIRHAMLERFSIECQKNFAFALFSHYYAL